jgi:hypothetical protein
MNKIIFSLLILFSINGVNAQTEKETIDFLNSMFTAYSPPMFNGPTKYSIRTEIDSRSTQKVIVIDLFVNNKLLETNKFHPIHITSISVSQAESGNFILKILSPERMILRKFSDENDETFQSFAQMPFTSSKDDTGRIRKALLHLLKLNGAKLIDENMFKN